MARAQTGTTPSPASVVTPTTGAAKVVHRALTPSPSITKARAQIPEDDGEEEPTRIAPPGALAGAFTAAVTEHAPASITDPLSMPGDEWFVGINGVPVGPIRLAELRAKAASGAITTDSLVWRDGFEEWRPLKSFPELVAIVEEGLSSTRASMGAVAATPSANQSLGVLADPFAVPAPLGAGATPAAAVTSMRSVPEDLDALGLRRRPATSPAAWLAMVVAVLFGITLGFVFFGRSAQAPDKGVQVAEKPAEKPATPTPAAESPHSEDKSPEAVIAADPKAPVRTSSASSSKSATKPEGDSKLTGGLKGLGVSGLPTNGPRGTSENSGSTAAPGTQLDPSQLQAVVARYTPSVKRSCWQPALDARDKDAPASARVGVAITIGPSGTVQDVTANGDPRGYRGLAGCIAGRVRGWQFPPSSGTTTVNVPFVFVAQ